MRLHLDEPKETVTPLHIDQAIRDCSRINNIGGKWARVEVLQTNSRGPVVRLEYGSILSDGTHEMAIGSYTYRLVDGSVSVTHFNHL